MTFFDKFSFWKKTPIIEFICSPELIDLIPEPKIAGNYIPNWYKKLPQTLEERSQFGSLMGSAKMCKPMIDAFSYGFTIPLAIDLHVRTNYNCTKIVATSSPNSPIPIFEFHNADQVGGINAIKKSHGDLIKFINHWTIKTAPGWSTLFIPPVNNFDLPFTCLSGIVDTDKYVKEVNFPAIWNVPDFDDTLKAGTPLVTVIPIKRKTFKQNAICRKTSEEEQKEKIKISNLLGMRDHYYADYLRQKK